MIRTLRTLTAVMLPLASGVSTCHAAYPFSDLVDAAKRGDGHAVHALIQSGSALDARGPMGYTALHWAGVRAYWRIFDELVNAGAPVNAVGSDGGTPLHWTCHHDRSNAVQRLLDAGGDVHADNRWGRTPLHVAARRNCLQVAALLLDAGSDPNATTNEGWTPMHVAARSGNGAMLELLERRGGDSTLTDSEGLTPRESWRQRPTAIDVEHADLEQYVGLYDLGHDLTIKVWLDGGGLRLREFAPDQLIAVGVDEFSCRQEPWRVRFERDSDGTVIAIEVDFLRRTVRGVRQDVPRYVGSRICIDCHTGADQGRQDVLWMQSRHGHAYWRLGADWALFLARLRPHYQDLENPIEDQRCRLCHTTGAQDPDAFFNASFRQQEGVSCEACHGPGSQYASAEVMANREAFQAAGGRMPDAGTCAGCHRNSDNFDWEESWPKIAHPKPEPMVNLEDDRSDPPA